MQKGLKQIGMEEAEKNKKACKIVTITSAANKCNLYIIDENIKTVKVTTLKKGVVHGPVSCSHGP